MKEMSEFKIAIIFHKYDLKFWFFFPHHFVRGLGHIMFIHSSREKIDGLIIEFMYWQ